MVVLAASICTKGGKAVISRQFRDMSRTRIDALLASFPKLIPANTQHTSVETAEVRYVYQLLEDLYIVLITNKASNILQDIETLHLFARVVSDMCRSADQREIAKNSFELLGAFDEIVSLGYREQVNLMQVRSILEMESHEEKIQEIISRNKEAEAKEELKRRAKQLEMQRREQQRRAASGVGGLGSTNTNFLGGGVSGYSPVPRFDAPSSPARAASPVTSSLRAPAFKGSGMKLGSKKIKQAELLDALGGSALLSEDISTPPTPSASTPEPTIVKDIRSSLPTVTPESVHITTKENITLSLSREGGIESLELKGDMNLNVTDPSLSRIKLLLLPAPSVFGPELQFKQHPNVAKLAVNKERIIALKDSSRGFPVNQSLAVLKWRYTGKDESYIPLSINCWPTPSNDGTCDVNIEYELENENVSLYDLTISIPLPAGSYPTVAPQSGEWQLNPSGHHLDWTIPLVNADDRSGALEFSVSGSDVNAFFPVRVSFAGLGNTSREWTTTKDVVFSEDASFTTDNYLVV
ncbi:hypothetical protein H4582DRAFT_2117694 [Lactarius indigo]|nr:hypothetical protein H4582DRAFT_2117694 [Lactarius indigo]